MTKLVHVFPDASETLLDAGLRTALAAAGAVRLQVNLDDGPVAGGLRLQAGSTAYRAVLSTWVDGDDAAAVSVLDDLAPVGGWRVEERVPTSPPVSPDGVRADALANVAFIRRPRATPYDAWIAHWHGPHTSVAIETQATFGYVQNVVVDAVVPGSAPVDGIVEELFSMDGLIDVHAFYGSGGDDAELTRRMTVLMESVAILGADHDLDLVPTSRYTFTLGG